MSATFDSGSLGCFGAFCWPVTLLVPHPGNGVVDVTELRLVNEEGVNRVATSDFSAGADRWFFVSDFPHLSWHSKNLLLHLWVEQGQVGIVVFVALVLAAWLRTWRIGRDSSLLPAVVIAGILALLVLSLFGSTLDFPSIALPLYFVLFAALFVSTGSGGAPSR